MKVIILIILFSSIFQGCHPDKFTLNFKDENRLFGKILGDIDSFEQINDNSFILREGTVAIRATLMTQTSISFTYKVIRGNEIDFILRNVPHKFNPDNGINIKLNYKGAHLYENNILIKDSDEIILTKDSERYVNIRNVGKLLHFRHTCDNIVHRTELPSTEYLIISIPKGGEVLISGMTFDKIMSIPSEKEFAF